MKNTGKNSSINDLQREATDNQFSVAQLLRKAKILASKLQQDEFLNWINNELDGYTVTASELPPYRQLTGTLESFNFYRDWEIVQFAEAKLAEIISSTPINQGVGALDNSMRSATPTGFFIFNLSPKQKKMVMDMIPDSNDVRLKISQESIYGILDAVRNSILDWTLKLQKAGIVENDAIFSLKDKNEATHVTHQFFAETINYVGSMSDQAHITNNSIQGIDVKALSLIVQQIKNRIGLLPSETQPLVSNCLTKIDHELEKPLENQEKKTLDKLLTSLKTICEGVAGNVVAQGIISAIASL